MVVTLSKLKLKDSQALNYIVNQIFKELDVERIQKCMRLLKWYWFPNKDRIPTRKEMKDSVRDLIKNGIKFAQINHGEWTFNGCGGFEVSTRYTELDHNYEECALEINVAFELTSADWWNDSIPIK